MQKLAILFLSVFIFFSAVPAVYADDKGFFEDAWESASSYFSDDDDGKDHEDGVKDNDSEDDHDDKKDSKDRDDTDERDEDVIDDDDSADDGDGVAPTPTPVADTAPPLISIQQPAITVEATAAQMTANLRVVTATDLVDGAITPTSDAPAMFPLGVTTVTYTATDVAGNTATAQQLVTVQDTTPPVITAPSAVTADSATGQPITVAIGSATATDAFVPVTVTSDAPASFPVGNTTVTWTATDANGNSATATQLITVNDASIFANLPPDPGPAGKATLAGIDSDNDGVRDDVQRWIVMNYPNSQKTRAALRQLAVDYQNSILDVTSKAVVRSNFVSMQKTLYCLSYIILDFYDVDSALKAAALNTTARSRAFLKGGYLLSGEVIEGLGVNYGKQGCNFNPDVMPN